MDSNPLFLTGNTDTVYALAMLDLDRDGPTVVEIPPGCGPGTVNDAWFRFIADIGAAGPDPGAVGSFPLVPAGYDGELLSTLQHLTHRAPVRRRFCGNPIFSQMPRGDTTSR